MRNRIKIWVRRVVLNEQRDLPAERLEAIALLCKILEVDSR
jgi:hypothetical protein